MASNRFAQRLQQGRAMANHRIGRGDTGMSLYPECIWNNQRSGLAVRPLADRDGGGVFVPHHNGGKDRTTSTKFM
jgi:hypothetical protein